MSEIMQCVFERCEPVRNVTALALMQYVCEEFPRSRVDDVVGMDNFMDKPSMGDDDILWSVEEREDDVVFTLVDRGSLTPDGVRAFVYKASSGFVRRNMDYQMVEAMLSACVRGTFAKDMRESGRDWDFDRFCERLLLRPTHGGKRVRLHPEAKQLLFSCDIWADNICTFLTYDGKAETFAECCGLDLLGTYVGAVMNGIDPDDSIAVSCYLTLPDEMPYLLEDMLVSECLRVLRIVNRANTLSRRYGWRTRWLPLPSVEPLPYPEWRAYFVDPTKPDFAFEHMQAHNV